MDQCFKCSVVSDLCNFLTHSSHLMCVVNVYGSLAAMLMELFELIIIMVIFMDNFSRKHTVLP